MDAPTPAQATPKSRRVPRRSRRTAARELARTRETREFVADGDEISSNARSDQLGRWIPRARMREASVVGFKPRRSRSRRRRRSSNWMLRASQVLRSSSVSLAAVRTRAGADTDAAGLDAVDAAAGAAPPGMARSRSSARRGGDDGTSMTFASCGCCPPMGRRRSARQASSRPAARPSERRPLREAAGEVAIAAGPRRADARKTSTGRGPARPSFSSPRGRGGPPR